LTPGVIKCLVLELFDGKLAERREIVDVVLREHLARGGKEPRAQDLSRSVKKALTKLQSNDLAENRSYGHWLIGRRKRARADAVRNSTDGRNRSAKIEPSLKKRPINAERIVGNGSGNVYLYYFRAYREPGKNAWPCKIGYTGRDPQLRILAQAAAALPEQPYVALVIRTDDPRSLEGAIHSVLDVRRRKVENSPGKEWYLTSPDEVLAIARFIDPHMVE